MLQEKMNNFGKRKSEKQIAKSQVPYPINTPFKAVSALLLLLLTTAPILTCDAALAQTAAHILAQAATPPVLPDALPKDSKLTIDGSGSLTAANQVLKEKFSAKYANTPVTFSTNGSAAGLKALVDGKVDLAAIGRSLTDAEKGQGLVEILVKREKIAMLVSEANPFTGSLTIQQFAKIFRGEVTDWSEVGGKAGAIRLVDMKEAIAGAIAQSNGTAIASTTASPMAAVPNAAPSPLPVSPAATPPAKPSEAGGFPWWLLLPLGLLGLWGLKELLGAKEDAINESSIPTVDPTPAATDVSPVVSPSAVTLDESNPTIATVQAPTADAPVVTPLAPVVGSTAVPDEAIEAAGLGAAAVTTGTAGLGLAAASPLVERSPRDGGLVSVDPWDEDEAIATVPHDLAVHGEGTAEVNPRHADGTSGELEFPTAAVVGATGIAAAVGLAGVGLGSAAATVLDDRTPDRIPDDRTSIEPHQPITQLPPDEYEPLEPDYAINPALSPAYNLADETVEDETPPAPFSNLPSPTTAAFGTAALGVGGIAAGIRAAGIAGVVGIGAAGIIASTTRSDLSLSGVDDGLPELPEGYGDSRIVLMARDPQWCYTYWDAPNDHRQALRNQGGQQFALRLYDITDLDLTTQKPHSLQQYACDETARDWYLAIPVSDRDYMAEIGYVTAVGGWLVLARSNSVLIPPVYSSDWHDDQFKAIEWEDKIVDSIFLQLVPPGQTLQANPQNLMGPDKAPSVVFGLSQTAEALRIAGSFYGFQSPTESLSSFMLPPEEAGRWTVPTPSGMGQPDRGLSGIGMSGIGMSGIGMSGIGMPRVRSRKFWLVADAELIVYGATEPDAQVTIGGVPVQLSPDGTFRLQMSFQDGVLDFPIMAIASDGEQMRQVKLTFNRSTTLRHTNTQEEAQDELF